MPHCPTWLKSRTSAGMARDLQGGTPRVVRPLLDGRGGGAGGRCSSRWKVSSRSVWALEHFWRDHGSGRVKDTKRHRGPDELAISFVSCFGKVSHSLRSSHPMTPGVVAWAFNVSSSYIFYDIRNAAYPWSLVVCPQYHQSHVPTCVHG